MTDEAYADVNFKSIFCEQIPEIFLDKLVAKNHFSKYGKIKRFVLRPNRLSCTVEYESEMEAERAIENAGNYNGYEFTVQYAERDIGHVQNTEEWVDADVQSELDAMGGGRQQSATQLSKLLTATTAPKTPSWSKSMPKSIEKDPTSPIQAPKVDAVVRSELEALLRQPAFTAEEKYRVLDARDKLIRLLSIRQTDIAKAGSRRGTCPDMCPEKERLMRDFQRQVSMFEMDKTSSLGSISHRRAIKEYSRSSADQEVPLSHELRSESVLKMTMLYLMHNIMDQLETTQVSVSDWFHFVWDRTRSVRKDITQQELCSVEAVELVEQCARFHIHCGARLVAEEPSVFDQKINAENLTKCLQTLKYLYHDLRLKNILCPREAEFRGFIVLLNLGNSNFLWEVKQLPDHIQQSNEIKRAMQFYNVLQNNNYVRFFKMVRAPETSYLSACILLNYFTKLRLRAMEAIVKSHNWRKNSVFLPLGYLTKILGFEDDEAAVNFFGYHGLECSEERGVMLERPTKASDYCMERALNLVESKRTVTVGECVCGHMLESRAIFENHQPHNSFNDNGFLTLESWTADDQLRGEAALAKAKETKRKYEPTTQVPQVKVEGNLFKVPQLSPQLSARQQLNQITAPTIPKPATRGFSLFAKQPAAETNKTLFSTNNAVAPALTQISSSSTDSIFKPAVDANITSGGNLFSSNTNVATSTFTKNIFGGAVTAPVQSQSQNSITKNLFAQPVDPKVTNVPRDNNMFQYFHSSNATAAGGHFEPKKPIFGAISSTSPNKQLQALEMEIKKQKAELAAEELKVRQREEAKRLLRLENERKQKLAVEAQQRKAVEEMEKARRVAAETAEATHRRQLQMLQKNADLTTMEIVKSVVDAEIVNIAEKELLLYRTVNTSSSVLTEEILAECIAQEVRSIAIEEFNIICYDRMLLDRYFTIWLETTRKKIEQRRLLETTPVWIIPDTREKIAKEFQHPTQNINLQMIKRYRYGESCDFEKLLWEADADLRWRQSIDICELITKYMADKHPLQNIQQQTYFKLLFALPSSTDEINGFESLCNKWLKLILRFPNDNDSDPETGAYLLTKNENVALCVRKVSGTPPVNESGQPAVNGECDHVDGILFFMSCFHIANTRRRLYQLLKNSRNYKTLPITFVVHGGKEYDEKELEFALDLTGLIEEKKLSKYRFFNFQCEQAEYKFKLTLEHALHYTISRSLKLNPEDEWEMVSTQNWLETCIGEEMWLRWQSSQLTNAAFFKICTFFPHVVGLYNEAIERLQTLIEDDNKDAPEFSNELRKFVPKLEDNIDLPLGLAYFPKDWKSKHRRDTLLRFLKNILLPVFEKSVPNNVNDLKMWLLEYACLCIPNDDEKASSAAYFAIKALIEQLTTEDLQNVEIPQRLAIISYLPVVKALAFAHVNEQIQVALSRSLPKEIIYRREALKSYFDQPWWLNFEAVKAVTVDYSAPYDEEEPKTTSFNDPLEDIEAVLEKAAKVSERFEQKMFEKDQQQITDDQKVNDSFIRQLDQAMYEFEAAKQAGLYDYNVSGIVSKSPRRSIKIVEPTESSTRKRKKLDPTTSKPDDIIKRALKIIDTVDEVRNLELKLDYTASQLEF